MGWVTGKPSAKFRGVIPIIVVDESEVGIELFRGEPNWIVCGDRPGGRDNLPGRTVEIGRDTSLGRIEESENVLVGVDEIPVDCAAIGHDERNIRTEWLPEEGIDFRVGTLRVVGCKKFHAVVDVTLVLGEGVVQIELFGDSPAECIVDEFKTSSAIDGFHKPVFRIPGVSPGTILGHVAIIVVLRRDGAAAHDIDSGVLVQAVCAIGLRGWILVGTGPVSDVVETIAHGVLRDVGSVFADCACDFGPLVVGVVPGCIVLERCGRPATKGVVDVSGLIGRICVDQSKPVIGIVGVGDGDEGGACANFPSLHGWQIGLVEVGIRNRGGIVANGGITPCCGIVGIGSRGNPSEQDALGTTEGVVGT